MGKRNFRTKYSGLNQERMCLEKLDIFERLISQHRIGNESKKIAERQRQADLDHEQHYDLDGVTLVNGKIEIQGVI